MLLLSPFDSDCRRVTSELSRKRNVFVAALADLIVMAYADPGGNIEKLTRQVLKWEKRTVTFDCEENQHLVEMGVEPMAVEEIVTLAKAIEQDSAATS